MVDNDFIYLSAFKYITDIPLVGTYYEKLHKHLEEAIVKTIFVKENAQSKENWRVINYSETTGLLLTENY